MPRLPPIDFYNDADCEDQATDAKFKAGADLKEGISGQLEICTQYENTDVIETIKFRS